MNESNDYRVWKAKIKYDLIFFKRKDISTWEEYCNFELNHSFKFVKFDNNDDLIIQRNSTEDPDYLRVTKREIFIGKHKDYIYDPLFKGCWKEESFLKLIQPNLNLTINQIKEYMKLVRNFISEKKLQIHGLEDPDILENYESNHRTISNFFRVVNLNRNHWICCTYFLPDRPNQLIIFDYQEKIQEKLLNLISRWFSEEQIFIYTITWKKQDENLSDYYSLAFLTEYVMNNDKICVSYFEKLKFDETKFMTHFFDCILHQQINTFPYLEP